MAEDANANIRIDIDTSEATAALKALQGQIARFHTEMARGGVAAGQAASNLQNKLVNSINAGGQFQAGMVKVQSTTEAFTTALEKNKLSMGQYFRYAGAATKTFGKFFGSEFQTITKVATERVKDLQTQYISMGRDANGALQSIKVRPLVLDMKSLTTQTMLATQKQQLYNQLLKQGSTNLLNFGKNTQWAGRQLMVGFTIPLTMFAAAAAKSFMDIEKQIIKIRRVYGDFNTTVQQTDEMIKSIRTLASEYTKYGVAVKDTIGLASEAAAAGKTGQELLAQVSEATRLAVLGNVEQTQALETTMSVTNAFGTATEDLAKKIDFLNAVENQSVTSIEDLTIAIPKAGPVVQQLGGDVEDLAFFLTAMKEGGINASEGANALKSGLAALINPTGKAKEMLQGFGINIEKIVNSNKGDIKGLVVDFASALDTLDPLNRARAIEQLFGKFQFSRLSTLFQNVIGEGTQASRVLELTKATTQELAILSQRELKRVEDTTTYKFEKAFADFQNALAPVGEEFLKVVTPIIEFGTKLLQQFNSMGDGAKAFTVILTTVVAGIGPALLMTVGLVANGVANLIKMFAFMGNLFKKTGGDATNLGLSTDYMTQQQIEAAAVAASLGQSHSRLTQVFSVEAAALNNLTLAYQKAITAQSGFAAAGGRVAGSATKPKKFATGGVVRGPGSGTSDSIPAMLSNGEAVIPAKQVKKYSGFIQSMISGNLPGYAEGGILGQFKQEKNRRVAEYTQLQRETVLLSKMAELKRLGFSSQEVQSRVLADPEYQWLANMDERRRSDIADGIGFKGMSRLSNVDVQDAAIAKAIQSVKAAKYLTTTPGMLGIPQIKISNIAKMVSKPITAIKDWILNLKDDLAYAVGEAKDNISLGIGKAKSAIGKAVDYTASGGISKTAGEMIDQASADRAYRLRNVVNAQRDAALINEIGKLRQSGMSVDQARSAILSNPKYAWLARMSPGDRGAIGGNLGFEGSLRIKNPDPVKRNVEAAVKNIMSAKKYADSSILGTDKFDKSSPLQKLLKRFIFKRYADGVVSVPGPKGAGDVVPAMLSPGEAVIPTKMAKKYGGLIEGMVADNIPGYEYSNITPRSSQVGIGSQTRGTAESGHFDITAPSRLAETLRQAGDELEGIDVVLYDITRNLETGGYEFTSELTKLSDAVARENIDIVAGGKNYAGTTIAEEGARNQMYNAIGVAGAPFQIDSLVDAGTRAEQALLNMTPAQEKYREQFEILAEEGRLAAQTLAESTDVDATRITYMRENAKRSIQEGLLSDARIKIDGKRITSEQASILAEERLRRADEELAILRQRGIKGEQLLQAAQNKLVAAMAASGTGEFVRGPSGTGGGVIRDVNTGRGRSSGPNAVLRVQGSNEPENSRNMPYGGRTAQSVANINRTGFQNLGMQIGVAAAKSIESGARTGLAGIITGFDAATLRKSPPQEAIDAGEDYGNALNAGARSKIDDAQATGEQLGQATVSGTQAGARKPGKRENVRMQTGVPGAGGFPVKTTSAGSQIIIGDTGRYLPEKPENYTTPAPGISETPIGPMTEKEYKKQEFARKHPILSKAGSSIAAGVKGMGGMGAGMGVAMAGGAVSMIPGLEGLGMAAGLAGSAMMMIPGSVGIVVAALIGLVGIIMSVQAAQEKQKQAAIDLANAQIMSMDKLNTMAEDLGTVSATEARIAAEDAAAAGVSQETINAGKQYLTEMASGQQIIEDIKTQQSAGIGSLEIGQNIAADMATAVSQGVVTQQQAQEIIAALGSLTGDRSITANASQQFGTYMEDPTKAPGMVASDRLAMVQRQFAGATAQSTQAAQYTTVAGEQVLVSPEKTISSITDANAAAGAAASTMNAYGQAVGGIDAINAKAAADIKEAKTTKEISEIVKQRNIDLAAQKVIIAETYAELEKQKTTITATKFDDAFLNSFDKDSDMYNTAIEINKMKDSDIKLQFQADFAGGNMSQATAESIIGAVDSDQALIGYYKLKVSVEVDRKQDALISRLLGVPTKAMAPDKPVVEDEDPIVTGGSSGGGSSAETVSPAEKRMNRINAALKIIGLQEAKINKKYEERKKALEEIAKINAQIAAQQKDQLDIADALSRGDIAAAARAAQQYRTNQAQRAQEAQAKALEDAQKSELAGVTFKGKTRESLEAKLANLEMRLAKREYRKLAGGGSVMRNYAGGGSVMAKYFADGGSPLGSDTVPAMLTPGEFVVKRPAVKNFGVKNLEAINNGTASGSSGVYNYSISVNVNTDADPDQIARAVAQNVKRTDSYRIRGNRK